MLYLYQSTDYKKRVSYLLIILLDISLKNFSPAPRGLADILTQNNQAFLLSFPFSNFLLFLSDIASFSVGFLDSPCLSLFGIAKIETL